MIEEKKELQVEVLHQQRLSRISELAVSLCLDKHIDNGGSHYYEKIIKFVCHAMIPNDYCLGTDYWLVYSEQKGEWLERAVMFLFWLQRSYAGVTLDDNELKMLASIVEKMRSLNGYNFKDLDDALQSAFDGDVKIYVSKRYILYIIDDLKDNLKQAIYYYNLLPDIISCLCLVVDTSDNDGYYAYHRDLTLDYPYGFSGFLTWTDSSPRPLKIPDLKFYRKVV